MEYPTRVSVIMAHSLTVMSSQGLRLRLWICLGQVLTLSQPWQWKSRVRSENCKEYFKEIMRRTTPSLPCWHITGSVYSPAQRLMSRRLQDLIPMATSKLQPQLTVPSVVTQNIAERKQKAKAHYDKRASKQVNKFTIGARVGVKPNPRNKRKPWIYGEVVDKPAPRSCAVSTPLGLVRYNHTQIRKASTDQLHCYSELVLILM